MTTLEGFFIADIPQREACREPAATRIELMEHLPHVDGVRTRQG